MSNGERNALDLGEPWAEWTWAEGRSYASLPKGSRFAVAKRDHLKRPLAAAYRQTIGAAEELGLGLSSNPANSDYEIVIEDLGTRPPRIYYVDPADPMRATRSWQAHQEELTERQSTPTWTKLSAGLSLICFAVALAAVGALLWV